MVLFLSSASIYFRLLPIPREGGIEGRSMGRNELAMEANQQGVASNKSEEVCDNFLIFVDAFFDRACPKLQVSKHVQTALVSLRSAARMGEGYPPCVLSTSPALSGEILEDRSCSWSARLCTLGHVSRSAKHKLRSSSWTASHPGKQRTAKI